jgi:hypothetical protein
VNPATTREQLAVERAALAKDFGTVEAMRASAFFESADVRLLNEPLRRAAYAAVDLYAVAERAAARLGAAAQTTAPQDPEASISNSNDTPRENLRLYLRSCALQISEPPPAPVCSLTKLGSP